MININTDKTLREKFGNNLHDYPIWYYKQLEKIDVEDVIFNLLKETFVVELHDKKIVMTFGKNKKHEIGCTQSCDEGLDYTSYNTIRKAFTEGKWFRITEENTTDEFKEEYKIKESERKRMSTREVNIGILTNIISRIESIPQEERDRHITGFQNMSDAELNELTELLFKQN